MTYQEKLSRRFLRSYKRAHPNQLQAIHKALDKVLSEPDIGEEKKCEQSGFLVYKFLVLGEEFLLAYSVGLEPHEIVFEALGPHENFYRDLKR